MSLGTGLREIIRLADKKIPVGLGFRESDDDEWPVIVAKIKAAHIVLFATPVWWGGRSSLIQRRRQQRPPDACGRQSVD